MNKYQLQSEIKSSGTAFLFWFLLGAHYAYLGKWGVQCAYWLTLGGLGVWAFIDLFRISKMVKTINTDIQYQIDELDKKEKEETHRRNMETAAASRS
jgi:hypothetical protein